MIPTILEFLLAPALFYLFVFWMLAKNQRRILYRRTRQAHAPEGIDFHGDDGTLLHADRLHGGRKKALIYFPGNTEAYWEDPLNVVGELPDDYTLYFAHYRGYGRSQGEPQERTLLADALSLYDRIADDHDEISVLGRSLGSAMAVYLAAHRRVFRLILVTPFDSIVHLARIHYPIFPVGLILRDRYESIRNAPLIGAATLILLASDDRTVPHESSEALIEALRRVTAVKLCTLPDTDHTSIVHSPLYWPTIRTFLDPRARTKEGSLERG